MKDLPYIVVAGKARIGAFPTMRRAVEFIEWRKTAARASEPVEYAIEDMRGKRLEAYERANAKHPLPVSGKN